MEAEPMGRQRASAQGMHSDGHRRNNRNTAAASAPQPVHPKQPTARAAWMPQQRPAHLLRQAVPPRRQAGGAQRRGARLRGMGRQTLCRHPR